MSKTRNVNFEIHPSGDGQFYCKTTVNESTYVGETVETKQAALKTARSTVKKIQAGLVKIKEYDSTGNFIKDYALTLLLILFATFSNGQVSQFTGTPTVKQNYCIDADGDGWGNNAQCKLRKKAPIGYVLKQDVSDCNDADSSVYPFGIEKWNSIDDNCSGIVDEGLVADLTLITTQSLAEPRLTAMPTVDIFFTGGNTPRNVTDPAYVAIVKALGTQFLESTSGVYAQYVRVFPQSNMTAGGMGYNISSQYADKVSEQLKSVITTPFLLAGKPYDFACAGDSLRKLIGAGGIIEANIATAPVEDWYVQIDRLLSSGQKEIIILPGQELVNDKSFFKDGLLYAKELDARIEQTEAKYPGVNFLWCIDAAALWKIDSKKNSLWNSQVATVKKAQLRDDYIHLMYILDEGFNDDLAHNLAEMDYAYKVGLPAQLNRKIGTPAFDSLDILITQWSSAIDAYTKDVQKNIFLTAQFDLQFIKTINEWNALNYNRVKGACWMNMKLNIDAKNNITLDFQLLGQIFKLFQPGALTCLASTRYSNVDVAATVAGGTYQLIVQNHSGIEIPRMVNIDVDGRHFIFSPITSTGLSVDSFYDPQAEVYDASTSKPLSLCHYTFK